MTAEPKVMGKAAYAHSFRRAGTGAADAMVETFAQLDELLVAPGMVGLVASGPEVETFVLGNRQDVRHRSGFSFVEQKSASAE